MRVPKVTAVNEPTLASNNDLLVVTDILPLELLKYKVARINVPGGRMFRPAELRYRRAAHIGVVGRGERERLRRVQTHRLSTRNCRRSARSAREPSGPRTVGMLQRARTAHKPIG
jgi:hypothetical protein